LARLSQNYKLGATITTPYEVKFGLCAVIFTHKKGLIDRSIDRLWPAVAGWNVHDKQRETEIEFYMCTCTCKADNQSFDAKYRRWYDCLRVEVAMKDKLQFQHVLFFLQISTIIRCHVVHVWCIIQRLT
jgi:hypothetical protein